MEYKFWKYSKRFTLNVLFTVLALSIITGQTDNPDTRGAIAICFIVYAIITIIKYGCFPSSERAELTEIVDV